MIRAALLLPLMLLHLAAAGAEVQVAVAANMAAPMRRIASAFERDTGHKPVLVIGSTGKFHAQVKAGAPFELLLAADAETPARLEREGLAVPGTRFTYAVGRLALWSAKPGVVDPAGDALRRETGRVAIADPKVAPYGAAAVQVLHKLGLWSTIQPRIVQGESVGQAFQFVSTGNAPLGFVALSQVMADGKVTSGSAWVVPAHLHDPIRQDAVILKSGEGRPAPAALAAYLRSDEARAILRSYGYEFPN